MKILIVPALAVILAFSFGSCKSSSGGGQSLLCDTACLNDTIKFTGDHKLKPYVYITVNNCQADSIIWSYNGMESDRKTKFDYSAAKMNKNFVRCLFKETDFAYILFNDCVSGRGFQIKLPYDKSQSFVMKTSGINNIDPKFSISDNIVAYTDRGNIYVEDINTNKKAMMTFGEKLDIDYDAIHEYIDSVNVTNSRIWVKVKVKEGWKELEKNITME